MNIDKVKTQIESVIDNVRGIPMTQAQCAELHSFFQKLIKPWEHCFTEKCPKGPDPRQKAFRSIAETIADTHSETKTISMDCYPASYVNVGWLRDTTKDLIEKREI